MTLILRPPGRGNWSTVELRVDGKRTPPPMFFAVGQRVQLGGHVFRVAKILP